MVSSYWSGCRVGRKSVGLGCAYGTTLMENLSSAMLGVTVAGSRGHNFDN